jgi:DNA polymerase elongation subunit (family B)
MIINIEQKQGSLIISYVNKDGKISYNQIGVPTDHQFSYVYAKPNGRKINNLTSWDGQPVTKAPSRFLDKHRIQEFFIDAGEDKLTHLFEANMPDLYSCDIEVDVTDDGFSEPAVAANRVNSISWVRYPNAYAFGVKPLNSEECDRIERDINKHVEKFNRKYNFVYKYYESESDMLFDFLYNFARHAPLITGWFFWGYDWQYIFNRCRRLNIDISFMSPTGQWYDHAITVKNEKVHIMLPQHKLIVDYLEIYKKWDRTIDVKENDTLDFVAEAALGVRKVKYPGTLKDLFMKDFEQYIFYNVIDSVLVELIDEKLKTMSTFLGLGNLTRVEAISAFSPIAMLEATATRYAYKRKQVFPKVFDKKEREPYEGAFVYEPVPGLYPLVASFDFASLYPSIMRQFGISIENFITKDKNYVPGPNQVKCINGAVFDVSTEPLLREILADYYNQRKRAKKVFLTAEEEIEQLKQLKALKMKASLS